MSAQELPPEVLLALQTLGLDIEAARARVQAWMLAHPGLSPSVDEVWQAVNAELTPERLQQAAYNAVAEGYAWLASPKTPVIEGDAPSTFG